MKISTKNKIETSFSMASMTDIVFLLLIFLLITARYTPQAIPVDLPLSTNEKVVLAEVHISITKTLQYYLEGEIVTLEQLENLLQEQLKRKSSKVVVLHMDQALSIAHMIKIADIATALGASVSIATELGKKG